VVIALFEIRKFSYVLAAFAIAVVFTSLSWLHFFRDIDTEMLTVYRIPGHSAIDLTDRGQNFFLADAALRSNAEKIRYHITPNRVIAGVKGGDTSIDTASLKAGRLILWRNRRILQLSIPGFELAGPAQVDYIVISNNAVRDPYQIRGIRCKKVILDSSNSFFFSSRFLEAAKLYKLDVHSVLHHGAFISRIQKQDT
jgi:competence protein ComEC